MTIQFKSVFLGFTLALLLVIAAIVGLFLLAAGESRPVFRNQPLPSGKTVQVTSCLLAWGAEHDERRPQDDCFALEYVSTVGFDDEAALDAEALEVFELIRPVSELWDFDHASVAAFATTRRKGKYYLYSFTLSPEGKWTFNRQSAKVFIND